MNPGYFLFGIFLIIMNMEPDKFPIDYDEDTYPR